MLAAASYVMFIDCCVHELCTAECQELMRRAGFEVKACCVVKLCY
jgi:hypothetical protein